MAHWNKSDLLRKEIVERMSPKQRREFHIETTAERMARQSDKSHKQVVNDIVCWLRQQDPRVEACVSRQDRKSTINPGWPDITFGKPTPDKKATASAAEVKVGSDQLSDDQIACHAILRNQGWYIRVVDSLEEFIRFYKSIGERL